MHFLSVFMLDCYECMRRCFVLDFGENIVNHTCMGRLSPELRELCELAAFCRLIGRRYYEAYSSAKSPHMYAQPSLFAICLMGALLNLTYRGVTELIRSQPRLPARLGIKRIPHYSTLIKFSNRCDLKNHTDDTLGQLFRSSLSMRTRHHHGELMAAHCLAIAGILQLRTKMEMIERASLRFRRGS